MQANRLPDYPPHPEPTEAGAEYDREEKPRSSPWMAVFGGLVLLVGLAFAMYLLMRLSPDGPGLPPASSKATQVKR